MEQLGLQSLVDQKKDSMINSSYSRKKLSEKSIVTHSSPKFFNASSLVNSISKINTTLPCIYESLLELDTITEPYFIIPPKGTVTINVKVNTQLPLESEFVVMTKYGGSKTVPVNIGIDTRVRKKGRDGMTPTNNNSNNVSNNLS